VLWYGFHFMLRRQEAEMNSQGGRRYAQYA